MTAREQAFEILGLPVGASSEDIKSAYRRLARQSHPDRVGEPGQAQFLKVAAAYKLLSQPPPSTKSAAEAAAADFFCDIGAAVAAKTSEHARAAVTKRLAKGGKISRAAAQFLHAVLDEAEESIDAELTRRRN